MLLALALGSPSRSRVTYTVFTHQPLIESQIWVATIVFAHLFSLRESCRGKCMLVRWGEDDRQGWTRTGTRDCSGGSLGRIGPDWRDRTGQLRFSRCFRPSRMFFVHEAYFRCVSKLDSSRYDSVSHLRGSKRACTHIGDGHTHTRVRHVHAHTDACPRSICLGQQSRCRCLAQAD